METFSSFVLYAKGKCSLTSLFELDFVPHSNALFWTSCHGILYSFKILTQMYMQVLKELKIFSVINHLRNENSFKSSYVKTKTLSSALAYEMQSYVTTKDKVESLSGSEQCLS
ncbi:unnamed protein product [Cuscuta europaea]|uniref:Uncharacterized protein n=1 Tax=Cuscuta europaea TaxID=41803 RepID=A0A9P1EGZ4_CUSEU|nr:unnamed protein product [Cuscuta europaea]